LICDEPIPAPKQTASQALALGVIQIPPDGQPIVMGPDRQTHGGYPVIGTVPDYALAQLAQIPATKHFHFNQISIEQAIVNFTLYQSQY
jgi:antagonist of KipI